mgnify:CR=1 FL=1
MKQQQENLIEFSGLDTALYSEGWLNIKAHCPFAKENHVFKTFTGEKDYDFIVDIPEIKKNNYIDYIIDMYDHLKPNGVLAVIVPDNFLQNPTLKKLIMFGNWLKNKNIYLKQITERKDINFYNLKITKE